MSDEKEVLQGYLRAIPPAHDMDSPGFKIVDFDGMGLAWGDFRRWEGKAVRITIEANPALEESDRLFDAPAAKE
jgi:hypothetical protein